MTSMIVMDANAAGLTQRHVFVSTYTVLPSHACYHSCPRPALRVAMSLCTGLDNESPQTVDLTLPSMQAQSFRPMQRIALSQTLAFMTT